MCLETQGARNVRWELGPREAIRAVLNFVYPRVRGAFRAANKRELNVHIVRRISLLHMVKVITVVSQVRFVREHLPVREIQQ